VKTSTGENRRGRRGKVSDRRRRHKKSAHDENVKVALIVKISGGELMYLAWTAKIKIPEKNRDNSGKMTRK